MTVVVALVSSGCASVCSSGISSGDVGAWEQGRDLRQGLEVAKRDAKLLARLLHDRRDVRVQVVVHRGEHMMLDLVVEASAHEVPPHRATKKRQSGSMSKSTLTVGQEKPAGGSKHPASSQPGEREGKIKRDKKVDRRQNTADSRQQTNLAQLAVPSVWRLAQCRPLGGTNSGWMWLTIKMFCM